MQNNEESILFLCRNIGPHQQKMVDILLEQNKKVTLLCTTKGLDEKYKPYLHPYFTRIANSSFANWTLILIAPILVFLDTLLFKRSKILGNYTTTFGWATAFAVNTERIIIAYGSDLMLYPYRNIPARITASFGLSQADKLLVDNISGLNNAFRLGFTGQYELTPFGNEIPSSVVNLDKRVKKNGETILWVRGSEPVYNIDCFIDALHILDKEIGGSWKVILAGNGTSSAKIKSKFSNASIKNKIDFLGYVKGKDKLMALFKKSSIYVSSSFSDGTSVSLLDAMSYGLTIVVSDFINNQFWIKNGYNGYLFDPNNPKELANILQQIITAKITIDERKKQVEVSRKKVKSNGSIDIFKRKFKKLVE